LVISARQRFHSHAATSDLADRLDRVQEEFRQGPCVDAALRELMVRSDDLTTEKRWPQFCPRAVENGVHSMLSFQLYAGGQSSGALNLMGLTPHAFTAADEQVGTMLVTHAAVAVQATVTEYIVPQ
jgi:GAF domain-containing protein